MGIQELVKPLTLVGESEKIETDAHKDKKISSPIVDMVQSDGKG